ncbi:MAG: hypothetical protein ACI8TP_001988, partial [Acidimicrobiales bacterium]
HRLGHLRRTEQVAKPAPLQSLDAPLPTATARTG